MSEEEQEQEADPSASTADDAENSGAGGGWYSWIQDAKSKAYASTLSTLELVKKDLHEFGDAVTSQATATVGVIKDHAPPMNADAAGGWMKSIVGTVNSVLSIVDTTEGEEKDEIPIAVAPGSQSSNNGSPRSRLFAIQSDLSTFADEPAGAPELFEDWLDHFDLESKKAEIRELLSSNGQARKIYAELVPQKMSNSLFWQRYFYKVHQFDLDQARRESLLKRSEQKVADDGSNRVDSWGDSDVEEAEIEKALQTYDEKELPEHLGLNLIAAAKADRKASFDSWTSAGENDERANQGAALGAKGEDIDVTSENSYCLVTEKADEKLEDETSD